MILEANNRIDSSNRSSSVNGYEENPLSGWRVSSITWDIRKGTIRQIILRRIGPVDILSQLCHGKDGDYQRELLCTHVVAHAWSPITALVFGLGDQGFVMFHSPSRVRSSYHWSWLAVNYKAAVVGSSISDLVSIELMLQTKTRAGS